MNKSSIEINQLKTLLYRIEASLDSPLFRSVFAEVDGENKDLTRNGQASCAVYVSGLLVWAEKLEKMRATVSSLEAGLKESGWVTTDELVPGAVVIWEAAAQAGGEHHEHAGFVLNETEAVSHSDKELCPVKHHITYGEREDEQPIRSIKDIYLHTQMHNIK